MARKRYSDEDALKVLREIDVHLHDGLDVVSSCRKAGISDKTYYYWRKKFGGMTVWAIWLPQGYRAFTHRRLAG